MIKPEENKKSEQKFKIIEEVYKGKTSFVIQRYVAGYGAYFNLYDGDYFYRYETLEEAKEMLEKITGPKIEMYCG